MVRISCAAAILVLTLAPLAWSEDGPEPGAGADPGADASAAESPRGEAETALQRALRERTEDMVRELRFPSGPRRLEILAAPLSPRTPGMPVCPAGRGGARTAAGDPCELGRRLAEMPPCLDPRDCEALHLWSDEVGPPSVQQAGPLSEDDAPSRD